MNCSQARPHIALLVGDDLTSEMRVELHEHLTCCASCRNHYQAMQCHADLLRSLDPDVDAVRRTNVWPRLRSTLAEHDRDRNVRHFNGWVATVAIAATCLAMVSMSRELRQPEPDPPTLFAAPAQTTPATPVAEEQDDDWWGLMPPTHANMLDDRREVLPVQVRGF